jgi:hypothetical protein
MPEVELNAPGIVTVVGELVTAGMTQPVWSSGRFDLRLLPQPDHQLVKSVRGEGSTAFGNKHVATGWVLFVF